LLPFQIIPLLSPAPGGQTWTLPEKAFFWFTYLVGGRVSVVDGAPPLTFRPPPPPLLFLYTMASLPPFDPSQHLHQLYNFSFIFNKSHPSLLPPLVQTLFTSDSPILYSASYPRPLHGDRRRCGAVGIARSPPRLHTVVVAGPPVIIICDRSNEARCGLGEVGVDGVDGCFLFRGGGASFTARRSDDGRAVVRRARVPELDPVARAIWRRGISSTLGGWIVVNTAGRAPHDIR